MKFLLPKIYPITDTAISGLSHAKQVQRLIDGGATLVQLREKSASPRSFYESAEEALQIAHDRRALIIINDRVDIALALGADGVHLGQDDMPAERARAILGPDAIIGLSTHSVAQALAALDLPIDYLAIGPVFATATKAKPDPVVGLEGVEAVRKAIGHTQLVAIGGIDAENFTDVLKAGADSAAIVRYLLAQPDKIANRSAELMK